MVEFGNGCVVEESGNHSPDQQREMIRQAVRAHFEAGRDTSDTVAPAPPTGLVATARLGRVVLDWDDAPDADLDGYDVFRATSGGPFTRINASRLAASAYTDTGVAGGTEHLYAVTHLPRWQYVPHAALPALLAHPG